MTGSHSRLRGDQPEARRVGGTTTERITKALAAESPGSVVVGTGVENQGPVGQATVPANDAPALATVGRATHVVLGAPARPDWLPTSVSRRHRAP